MMGVLADSDTWADLELERLELVILGTRLLSLERPRVARRGPSNLIVKFVQYKDNGTFLHIHRSVSLFTTKSSPHKH